MKIDHTQEPGFQPYIDVLLDRLNARADEAVLRYRNDDVTGDALRRAIFRHARALAELGIGRGTLVALFAPNCPDALAVRYAANLLGAAAMFLAAPNTAERRAALIARIRPALLVVFPGTAHLVPEGVNVRVKQIGFGPASSRLDALAYTQDDRPMKCRALARDLCVVASSGGTTDIPKGSCRSFAAYSALAAHAPDATGQRRLVNGPLAYLSQVLVDSTLIGGGTVVLESHYDAADTLAAIEAERVTDVLLVEPQLFEVMDHPDVRRRDLSSLRSIAHIGGSAPAILRRRAIDRLGPVLTHLYGASEAGLVSALTPAEYRIDASLLNSAGRVRPGVEVRFRRADGGICSAGEAGSIEVRSASVAQGYRHQPADEARKFRDGWCLTGDIGYLDDRGYLHILGRAADVMRIDGRAIGPAQIEDVLCALPDVRYAVAFAAGIAFDVAIEPWPGRTIDLARCARALDAAFGPRVANTVRVAMMPRVPLTEQGKPDRTIIAQRCRSIALEQV